MHFLYFDSVVFIFLPPNSAFVLVLIIFSWVVYQTSQGQSLKPQMVWAQELQKGEDDELTLVGSAFQVKSEPANIDDLKEGIKEKAESKGPAFKMDIYYRTDGKWQVQEVDAPVRDDTSKAMPYGYVVP